MSTTPKAAAPAHTPGPWRHAHRDSSDGMFRTEVFSDEHGLIASCDWTPQRLRNVTATYREANARLIAAAPLMLEALRVIVALDDGDNSALWPLQPEFDAARAAIAAATGTEAQTAMEALRAAIAKGEVE